MDEHPTFIETWKEMEKLLDTGTSLSSLSQTELTVSFLFQAK